MKGVRFSHICVDGVSCKSQHIMRMICEFLSCNQNHVGAMGPNHNDKFLHCVAIAGGGKEGQTMGHFVLNQYHLRIAAASMDLLQPGNFAADLLVTRLLSSQTIELLARVDNLSRTLSLGDRGILGLNLFFINI